MSFATDYHVIRRAIRSFDPKDYSRTRNFVNGSVSRLSPYISRGVISSRMVVDDLKKRGYDLNKIEKFVQELAWRDYWQQAWMAKGDAIDQDLKHTQENVEHHGVPRSILNGSTGIIAVDTAIKELQETGYMHNHVRMYVAALACNIGHSHWRSPARWMYYHLLDADWASNALSWQWVAGANANKKYIADQSNINKYCGTDQTDTFLSISYEQIASMETPNELSEVVMPEWTTPLPLSEKLDLESDRPTYLYNWYNLDPAWCTEENAQHVLLLEPSIFARYPISQQSVDFMLALSENIKGIRIHVGEFEDLMSEYSLSDVHYKEHPLNVHYQGTVHPRDWIYPEVTGYFSSFFQYWKACQKADKVRPSES